MASIETINKRIAGAQKNIAKLEAKLARIRKVEAQGWEDPNPYFYSEYDLRICLEDLAAARASLVKYQEQLEQENAKAASRNVPAITAFLNAWRSRVKSHYIGSEDGLEAYYMEKAEVTKLYNTRYNSEEYRAASKAFRAKCHGYYERRDFTNRWGKPDHTEVKVRDGEFEWLLPYCEEKTLDAAIAKLTAALDQEWNRKYDFIIERTTAIVGTITDASGLEVGAKGDLNGKIIGSKGVAKVQTIGAGGYAVQCYHFRTLINAVK